MRSDILAFVLRRVAQAVPLVFAIITAVFAIVHLAPGDPLLALVGDGGTPQFMADMRARYGLDASLPTQYWRYVSAVVGGDLGYSFTYRAPVADVVLARLPASAALAAAAVLLGSFVGLLSATLCAAAPGTTLDRGVRALAAVGYALPVFWTGQILILVFAARLGWFPVLGRLQASDGAGLAALGGILRHLALPTVALSLPVAAAVALVTRAALLDPGTQHHVWAARARGLGANAALVRHGLPTVLAPVVTLVAHQMGHLLTGAALAEVVFAWPGLGQLLLNASMERDRPLLLGVLLVASLAVVGANLAADLTGLILDPRQRRP